MVVEMDFGGRISTISSILCLKVLKNRGKSSKFVPWKQNKILWLWPNHSLFLMRLITGLFVFIVNVRCLSTACVAASPRWLPRDWCTTPASVPVMVFSCTISGILSYHQWYFLLHLPVDNWKEGNFPIREGIYLNLWRYLSQFVKVFISIREGIYPNSWKAFIPIREKHLPQFVKSLLPRRHSRTSKTSRVIR